MQVANAAEKREPRTVGTVFFFGFFVFGCPEREQHHLQHELAKKPDLFVAARHETRGACHKCDSVTHFGDYLG